MKQTLESKTADTILQDPISIEIGGRRYDVAPPSIATLVLVSKEISTLPDAQLDDTERLMQDTLSVAKDCNAIGNIAAVLVLGAKGCKTKKRIVPRRKKYSFFWGLLHFSRQVQVEEEYNPKEEFARKLMEDMTPRDVQNLIARILQQMQIGDFFGLTTFLLEVNLTRQTKVDSATAYGQ